MCNEQWKTASLVIKLDLGPYCRYCVPLLYRLASNIYNTLSDMSLSDITTMKIVDEVDDNTNISVLFNTIFIVVCSIDVSLQSVEKERRKV